MDLQTCVVCGYQSEQCISISETEYACVDCLQKDAEANAKLDQYITEITGWGKTGK